jgi:hypothetical protein
LGHLFPYFNAADQAELSRIWGDIHVSADDVFVHVHFVVVFSFFWSFEDEDRGRSSASLDTFAVDSLRQVCYPLGMKTTLSVTEAQRKLLRLVASKETITLRQREETVAFIVPRERMEALLETMEIMANPAAMRAIRRDQCGKGKYLPLSVLDENEG